MALALRFAARSDVGLLRDGNEDSGYAGPRLLVVADGMGGHAAGEVASSVAVATLAALDEDTPGPDLLDRLTTAVREANQTLRDMVAGDSALQGMGTTLTGLLRSGSRLGLVHVGDSRCYLLREGTFQRITRDHTFVQTLVDEGRISEDEANHHPQRSLLTRALDGRGDVELDLSVREARSGDRYLLCTDGLSGVVSDTTLYDTLSEQRDPEDACRSLVDLALRGGGPDNITCVVADVVDVEAAGPGVPLVVGAATEPADRATNGVGSQASATRAAALHVDDGETSPDDEGRGRERTGQGDEHRHRSWLRRGLVLAVIVALVGAVGYVAYDWSQQQYFVAAADNEHVAIYRGLSQNVAGLPLSQVLEEQDVTLEQLPMHSRERVSDTIPARDLTHARSIVERLADQAQACAQLALAPLRNPAPTATPPTTAPGATATATPGATPTATPGAATPTATPTVTPSPDASVPAAVPPRVPPGCEGVEVGGRR